MEPPFPVFDFFLDFEFVDIVFREIHLAEFGDNGYPHGFAVIFAHRFPTWKRNAKNNNQK